MLQNCVFADIIFVIVLQAGPALKRQSSGDSGGLAHAHPSLSRGASLDSPKVTWFTLRPPDCETAGSTQPWKFFWPGEWQSASFSSRADTEGDAQNLDLQDQRDAEDLEPSDQLACHTLSSMESKDPNLTRALLALNQVQLQPTLFRLQAPTLPDQNVLTALLHLSFLDGSTLKRGHQPNEHLCQQTQTHWMQTHNVQTNLYVQLSQFCE